MRQRAASACWNCDLLAVVVVADCETYLAGRNLASTERADDYFCRLQF